MYYVIVICNWDPGTQAIACACEILHVYVYVLGLGESQRKTHCRLADDLSSKNYIRISHSTSCYKDNQYSLVVFVYVGRDMQD